MFMAAAAMRSSATLDSSSVQLCFDPGVRQGATSTPRLEPSPCSDRSPCSSPMGANTPCPSARQMTRFHNEPMGRLPKAALPENSTEKISPSRSSTQAALPDKSTEKVNSLRSSLARSPARSPSPRSGPAGERLSGRRRLAERAHLHDTWAKGLKPSRRSTSECRFHMPLNPAKGVQRPNSFKSHSPSPVPSSAPSSAGPNDSGTSSASAKIQAQLERVVDDDARSEISCASSTMSESRGSLPRSGRRSPARRPNGLKNAKKDLQPIDENARANMTASNQRMNVYTTGKTEKGNKSQPGRFFKFPGGSQESNGPIVSTPAVKENVPVSVPRSPMYDVLAHPETQPQRKFSKSPEPKSLRDIAERGRSPEAWRPSLDADDRSGMAALIAHKEDPHKHPCPVLREGTFVSWSGNSPNGNSAFFAPHNRGEPERSPWHQAAQYGNDTDTGVGKSTGLDRESLRGRSFIDWSSR